MTPNTDRPTPRQLIERLADATEGVLPFVRVGDGPLGDDPAARAMRHLFDVLGECRRSLDDTRGRHHE